MTTLDYIYLIPLSLSAILSLKAFSNQWASYFKLLSLFLIITLLTESFALIWLEGNYRIYNISFIPKYMALFFFFGKVLTSNGSKSSIYLYCFLPIITFLILLFISDSQSIQTNVYLMCITCLICVFLVFKCLTLFNNEAGNSMNFRHPMIWVILATLTIHFITYPVGTIAYHNLFKFDNLKSIEYQNSFTNIFFIYLLPVLNIISYTFYAIAFLCKPLPKISV